MADRQAAGGAGPVKPVFNEPSPGSALKSCISTSSGSALDKLVERHGLPDDVNKAIAEHRTDEHRHRMKNLRRELHYINETAWQFKSTDTLFK